MTKNLSEIKEELEDAANLCCDELGEWWTALADLYPCIIDGGSKEFLEAYEKEMVNEYERFKSEFKIIEETETRSTTNKRLVHESEDGYQ